MRDPDYKSCIDACLRCATLCDHCAASCLAEENVHMMSRCIQLDMECSAMCYTSARLMSLGSEQAKAFCGLCAEFCERCADECEKHEHEHCKECAGACRACADHCRKMAS